MHKACHQLYLDCKSVNTKRLSPYAPGKGGAESFPQLGLAVSLLGRHCNRQAIRVRCGFGKSTIVDSLMKGRLDSGYISALDE
jgi:hypothetical protein